MAAFIQRAEAEWHECQKLLSGERDLRECVLPEKKSLSGEGGLVKLSSVTFSDPGSSHFVTHLCR
jgi:hypothetical protein